MISGYSFSPILKQNCKTPHLGRDVTFLYKAISFPLGGLIRNRQGRRRASRRHQWWKSQLVATPVAAARRLWCTSILAFHSLDHGLVVNRNYKNQKYSVRVILGFRL